MRKPIPLTVLLLVAAAAVVFLGVASVSAQVNSSAGEVHATFGILGMPIVVGLKQAGYRRLEFGWGTVVILAVPFVVGQLAALRQIMKRRPAIT